MHTIRLRHMHKRRILMENEEVILTQEGYDKLEQQLEYLKTTERTEIAGRIKIALGYLHKN